MAQNPTQGGFLSISMPTPALPRPIHFCPISLHHAPVFFFHPLIFMQSTPAPCLTPLLDPGFLWTCVHMTLALQVTPSISSFLFPTLVSPYSVLLLFSLLPVPYGPCWPSPLLGACLSPPTSSGFSDASGPYCSLGSGAKHTQLMGCPPPDLMRPPRTLPRAIRRA